VKALYVKLEKLKRLLLRNLVTDQKYNICCTRACLKKDSEALSKSYQNLKFGVTRGLESCAEVKPTNPEKLTHFGLLHKVEPLLGSYYRSLFESQTKDKTEKWRDEDIMSVSKEDVDEGEDEEEEGKNGGEDGGERKEKRLSKSEERVLRRLSREGQREAQREEQREGGPRQGGERSHGLSLHRGQEDRGVKRLKPLTRQRFDMGCARFYSTNYRTSMHVTQAWEQAHQLLISENKAASGPKRKERGRSMLFLPPSPSLAPAQRPRKLSGGPSPLVFSSPSVHSQKSSIQQGEIRRTQSDKEHLVAPKSLSHKTSTSQKTPSSPPTPGTQKSPSTPSTPKTPATPKTSSTPKTPRDPRSATTTSSSEEGAGEEFEVVPAASAGLFDFMPFKMLDPEDYRAELFEALHISQNRSEERIFFKKLANSQVIAEALELIRLFDPPFSTTSFSFDFAAIQGPEARKIERVILEYLLNSRANVYRKISLLNSRILDRVHLLNLLVRQRNLHSLDISGAQALTSDKVSRLVEEFEGVQRFVVRNFGNFVSVNFRPLKQFYMKNFGTLTDLVVTDCRNLRDFSASLPLLKRLDLSLNPTLSSVTLNTPALSELFLRGSPNISDKIVDLVRPLTKLEVLLLPKDPNARYCSIFVVYVLTFSVENYSLLLERGVNIDNEGFFFFSLLLPPSPTLLLPFFSPSSPLLLPHFSLTSPPLLLPFSSASPLLLPFSSPSPGFSSPSPLLLPFSLSPSLPTAFVNFLFF
jgi:hypothetical protein